MSTDYAKESDDRIDDVLARAEPIMAIQADESGTPVVIELVNGKSRIVTAERWAEILNEEIDAEETPQAIVPIIARPGMM